MPPLPLILVVLFVYALAGAGGDEKRYRIPSSAMEPTLHCARPAPGCEADEEDVVVAERVEASELRRGDIVIFETPSLTTSRCGVGGTFVKRVIGLPGERLELRWDRGVSIVYINGKRLDEPYIEPGRRDARSPETFRVPQGEYFVMGDNRPHSCDSREWGGVPAANIHHRVVAVERPSGRIDFR